jgi:hypothetical protein
MPIFGDGRNGGVHILLHRYEEWTIQFAAGSWFLRWSGYNRAYSLRCPIPPYHISLPSRRFVPSHTLELYEAFTFWAVQCIQCCHVLLFSQEDTWWLYKANIRAAAMDNIILKLHDEGDAEAKHDDHDEELVQPLPDFWGHLATFVNSAPYPVIRLEPAHLTFPTLLHSVLLIGFHTSFMRKGTPVLYSKSLKRRVGRVGGRGAEQRGWTHYVGGRPMILLCPTPP